MTKHEKWLKQRDKAFNDYDLINKKIKEIAHVIKYTNSDNIVLSKEDFNFMLQYETEIIRVLEGKGGDK